MSVIAKTKSTCTTLAASALLALACSIASLPACSIFAARNQSTVAQGRYYAAGDPRYDEFFVGLFLLQVQMEQAPHLPELERLNLAHALGLTPQASSDEVGLRLHEEAQKLSRSGLRMRLDQSPSNEKPDSASAALRTNERPKDRQTTALIGQIETSATTLLRSMGELKQADDALDGLELAAGGLDASVDKDFAAAPAGKLDEVKKNLADSHKLIALMKVRAGEVRGESEQLLGDREQSRQHRRRLARRAGLQKLRAPRPQRKPPRPPRRARRKRHSKRSRSPRARRQRVARRRRPSRSPKLRRSRTAMSRQRRPLSPPKLRRLRATSSP